MDHTCKCKEAVGEKIGSLLKLTQFFQTKRFKQVMTKSTDSFRKIARKGELANGGVLIRPTTPVFSHCLFYQVKMEPSNRIRRLQTTTLVYQTNLNI